MDKKLSEIKNNEILYVNNKKMTKNELLQLIYFFKKHHMKYKNLKVTTNPKYDFILKAEDLLKNTITKNNDIILYNKLLSYITKKDIDDIQNIFNKIIEKYKKDNIYYNSNNIIIDI